MPYTAGPFDAEHMLVQWGGKLPGLEGWSCSIRFAWTAGGTAAYIAGWDVAVKNAIQAWHTSSSSATSSQCKLSFVKANIIGTDGHYVGDTSNTLLLADVAGASAAAPHPAQVALAVTTKTAFSRGPAHAGRFFSPMPCFVLGSDGLITSGDQTTAKTAATTLLTSLNAASASWQVAVFSRKLGAPAHRLVTAMSVGRVLDTQRRRRAKLTELWN